MKTCDMCNDFTIKEINVSRKEITACGLCGHTGQEKYLTDKCNFHEKVGRVTALIRTLKSFLRRVTNDIS